MTPTCAVQLTAPGRGAVAVVLVAGPEAARIVDECFAAASGRPLAELPIGRIAFGRWGSREGEELVVCRRSDSQVEVHCHGGSAAVGAVLDLLIARGCHRMTWQEWVRSGIVPTLPQLAHASESDAIMREAEIALAEATTLRAAAILLDQCRGALSQAIRSMLTAVARADWTTASRVVDDLLSCGDLGLHLTRPWRVVLAGAPNVGKSSLINALAGFERAIVSPLPGTTRDVVTTTTAIGGWPVQLADTAGIRDSDDSLEAAGVALATEVSKSADLVVHVWDARDDRAKDAVVSSTVGRVIHVKNKIDLATAAVPAVANDAAIATSTVTGEGLDALLEAIREALIATEPPAGAAIPFTPQQVASLRAVKVAVSVQDSDTANATLLALLTD